jgi:protein-S-isoprenylcysteine O-methyltransferase Ste14
MSNSAIRWFKSTPKRTFILLPVLVIAFELAARRGHLAFRPWGVIFLVWGYAQYRLSGLYRIRNGGGGPGIEVPPKTVVSGGPYRYLRNPMYLGHLIFMAGLAITFSSWLALALLVFHIAWFQKRVVQDEARLEARFGAPYRDYKARVKRWIPGVI